LKECGGKLSLSVSGLSVCLEGLRKTTKYTIQGSPPPKQNSNPGIDEYKVLELTT